MKVLIQYQGRWMRFKCKGQVGNLSILHLMLSSLGTFLWDEETKDTARHFRKQKKKKLKKIIKTFFQTNCVKTWSLENHFVSVLSINISIKTENNEIMQVILESTTTA